MTLGHITGPGICEQVIVGKHLSYVSKQALLFRKNKEAITNTQMGSKVI